VVLYFACDESAYVTGSDLMIGADDRWWAPRRQCGCARFLNEESIQPAKEKSLIEIRRIFMPELIASIDNLE
jgi:hypothetical protein